MQSEEETSMNRTNRKRRSVLNEDTTDLMDILLSTSVWRWIYQRPSAVAKQFYADHEFAVVQRKGFTRRICVCGCNSSYYDKNKKKIRFDTMKYFFVFVPDYDCYTEQNWKGMEKMRRNVAKVAIYDRLCVPLTISRNERYGRAEWRQMKTSSTIAGLRTVTTSTTE